ncbi:MAG: peptidylprolyl isomerase [Elusimicrobiota bacterium]|jgi:peptidyl-prolyl cis-trans isomerase A (cyclophilin A)
MKKNLFLSAVVLILAAGGVRTLQAADAPKMEPAKAAAPAKKAASVKADPAKKVEADKAKSGPTDPKTLLAPEKAVEKAPDVFRVKFATTKGEFVIEARRDWAPNGVDRFYNLVKLGYFDGVSFFRVVKGFMVQFGIHGTPEVNAAWRSARIMDDPVKNTNARGTVTYAMAGPNTRTTQLFINYGNNAALDGQGFPPFGQVVKGMEVVEKLYDGYGDMPDFGGRCPDQGRMQNEGDPYLKKDFAKLDYVKTARLAK